MKTVPLLTDQGYQHLLDRCSHDDRTLRDPTEDAIHELLEPAMVSWKPGSVLRCDPPLVDGPEDPILEEPLGPSRDAAILERWLAGTLSEQIDPVRAVDPKVMVSLACFALPEFAKRRWGRSKTGFNPHRHLLAEGATELTGDEHRLFHTAGRLWWLQYTAGRAVHGEDLRREEQRKIAELLASNPDFFHCLLKRPLVMSNRRVLQSLIEVVRSSSEEERKHLTRRDVITDWIRQIGVAGGARFLDMLDRDETRRVVTESKPRDKSRPGPRFSAAHGRARHRSPHEPEEAITVLSLGGGVQSTTLYLLAVHGDLASVPDIAIFADTGWEPRHVYETLNALKERYGDKLPIETVKYDNLYDNSLTGRENGRDNIAIPVWTENDGEQGQFPRRCTVDYKIKPIVARTRERIGLVPRRRVPGKARAHMWLGISTDEVLRIKPNEQWWIENRYPLIQEKRWSRDQCEEYLAAEHPDIPVGRSACAGCPYRSEQAWIDLERTDPELFDDAVLLDEALREKSTKGHQAIKGTPYLHRTRQPLREAVAESKRVGPSDGSFGECEGYCGL